MTCKAGPHLDKVYVDNFSFRNMRGGQSSSPTKLGFGGGSRQSVSLLCVGRGEGNGDVGFLVGAWQSWWRSWGRAWRDVRSSRPTPTTPTRQREIVFPSLKTTYWRSFYRFFPRPTSRLVFASAGACANSATMTIRWSSLCQSCGIVSLGNG